MGFEDNTFITAEGAYYRGILKDIKKHKDPLQPLFEAFTNALESIHSTRDGVISSLIVVKLYFAENTSQDREFCKMVIEDSGIGFNDTEFKRFTTYKDNRKGYHNKGSGRIQLIHYFNNCQYTSIYKEGAILKRRSFRISKAERFLNHNAITYLESTKDIDAKQPTTILTLSDLGNEKDKAFYNALTVGDLKNRIISHYIPHFCVHRDALPQIKLQYHLLDDLEEELTIEAQDIPEIDDSKDFVLQYHSVSSDGKEIIETGTSEVFTIKAFRITKDKLDRNSVKLTSKSEIVESNDHRINLNSLAPEDYIDNHRFLFLVSSPYIDSRDDDTRGDLKIPKRDNYRKEMDLFSDEEIFFDDIEEKVNENVLMMYDEIKKKNEEKRLVIEELKDMFLLNDDVLTDISISLNDTEEKILEKVYVAESKLIAKGDYEIKRQIDDLDLLNPSSVNYSEEFNEAIKKLVKEIPQQNRVALTHYVARRKLVLELFKKILDRKLTVQNLNNRNIDEKLLHNLIFKQQSDTPDTSDLWLVNEDFILFKGTSEFKLKNIVVDGVRVLKKTLTEEELSYRDSLSENRYEKRPDVLLFPDEGKCIIIEFKAPQVNVSEHLSQINRYASLIRNLSRDDMQFDTFYGYLIGENIDPDDVRDFDGDFKNAPHFNYVFRPSKPIVGRFGRTDGSLYMEVIKYSTLLERAMRRNDIFIEKLYESKRQNDDAPF